jgi:hypothetical protein
MEAKEQEQEPEFGLEAAVDAAIAACGGDPRAAVRSLVIANDFLSAEAERFRSLCSTGFARGKLTLRDLP